MNRIFTYTFWLAVAACLYLAVGGCAALKKAGWTAGGAGGGAALGSVVGGPVGAGVGGAVGAVASTVIAENTELRDGDLVGHGAAVRYITREVPVDRPFIPTWLYLAVGGYLALTKGHHVVAFFKGYGFGRLLNVVLPSWAQKKLKTS